MKNKKKKIAVINLSNYNAPKVYEEIGRKFIFYGARHRYFKYIEECYIGSVTNRSVINGIAQMMYGKGLNTTNDGKNLEAIKKLFKAKDVKRIVKDYKKFGQACFQVGYAGKGNSRKVVKIMHHPVQTIAKSKKDKKGMVKEYYFSTNWENYNKDYSTIPAFGTSNKEVELYYIEGDIDIVKYYAECDYQAGLQYCKVEEELSNFHVNNVQNGFNPGLLINFNNGIPDSEEEQSEIERDVKKKWGGTSNTGNIIISFNEGQENAPTIEPIPISDAADQYALVSEEARDKIMMSHRVTSPMLFGINSSNGISSNTDELVTSYLLFNSSIVEPLQEDIINAFNDVLSINNMADEDLFFENTMPAYFAGKSLESIDTSKMDEESITEIEKELGTGIKTTTDGTEQGQE